MIFHVINRETGEVVQARGFFAIGEDGVLYDVQDGWGCEGGGGSDTVDSRYVVVLGPAPKPVAVETKPVAAKSFECEVCAKKFGSALGLEMHKQNKGH